ncbi:MAG: GNAT family N-acetyltransferase [Bacteroidota bacterium]|nr:GNAT family N-acetyltransferase [Bacteroidota bacterium]MDX5431227.1 GNAT family N-acetyltransferase [Bacteroidota bacterium]MDX5469966.1 GNAT family N-acetyltransferase [Bacteroidota bacterium]
MASLKNQENQPLKLSVLTAVDQVTQSEKFRIAQFLHKHLGKYGDEQKDIMKCLDYATSYFNHQGGFIVLAEENREIIGAVVMNQTGMEGYIPENILVYIAVHESHRGRGLGKQLMEKAIGFAKGGIALHVEPDNPARYLYEKLGFTHKYLEMRRTQ